MEILKLKNEREGMVQEKENLSREKTQVMDEVVKKLQFNIFLLVFCIH